MNRLTPPRLLILSFLGAIILGALLLSLPQAVEGPARLSFVDSLFTATSATCVTGLVVKDTGSHFSAFGRWIIFVLFQAGGLGIMTFSTFFAVMLGRKVGFRESDAIRGALDKHSLVGLKKLILYILGITVIFESAGAFFLFLRWRHITTWSAAQTLERAVFHSVSAFCNAGFSLFRNSFTDFQRDPYINLIVLVLIFFGGIGFIVIMDIMGFLFRRKNETARKMSLQSKVVLSASAALIAAGALLILLVEKDRLMQGMSVPGRVWGAVFQSISARTCGFNTLPIGSLAAPSLLFLVFLMFIGASPGSTGGGIKTCTFAVLAANIGGIMKNRKRVMMFGRSIPRQVIREALAIFFLAVSWIFVFTLILTHIEMNRIVPGAGPAGNFLNYLFEVVSAFGTVGLSTGVTPHLSGISKLCVTLTMFVGRLGPLTIALAVAFRRRRDMYTYPEENIMVG